MRKEKEPSQVAGTTSEVEIKLLLHVIEQGMQSILMRDKYIRVLLTIQIVLVLYLVFK